MIINLSVESMLILNYVYSIIYKTGAADQNVKQYYVIVSNLT